MHVCPSAGYPLWLRINTWLVSNVFGSEIDWKSANYILQYILTIGFLVVSVDLKRVFLVNTIWPVLMLIYWAYASKLIAKGSTWYYHPYYFTRAAAPRYQYRVCSTLSRRVVESQLVSVVETAFFRFWLYLVYFKMYRIYPGRGGRGGPILFQVGGTFTSVICQGTGVMDTTTAVQRQTAILQRKQIIQLITR